MTTKRIITALTAIALSGMLLAGCTTVADPTPAPSTATPTPTPTPTLGTKVPPPASEDDAIASAEETAASWLTTWAEIESSGATDTSALEVLSTDRALRIAQNSIQHIRTGPIPNKDGNPVEGAGSVEGQIRFEPQSAYGQVWEDIENGLVIIDGCQDLSERIVTTHDGTPGQQADSLRNMIQYKVIYDASQELWLVQDLIDLQQPC